MRVSVIIAIATVLSLVQAYASYLLHNDVIQFAPLQLIIAIFYIPLYIVLLLIGGALESLFTISLLKGGVMLPYLRDVLWFVAVVILFPINFQIVKFLVYRKCRT